jgi:DNA-binding NtrC family response regulator
MLIMAERYAWIDDEEVLLGMVKLNFELEGAGIDCYANPSTAINLIRRGEFAGYKAVITDMRMPLVSGEEIIEALNESGYGGRVYAASGNVNESDKLRLKGRGVVGFFDKPFVIDDAIATVIKEDA